ncbi:MAG: hypothetical protein QXJ75_05750 [Candidatus Bathyarchaeia archaeon]
MVGKVKKTGKKVTKPAKKTAARPTGIVKTLKTDVEDLKSKVVSLEEKIKAIESKISQTATPTTSSAEEKPAGA